MPKINIPMGSQISQTHNRKAVEIRVPNTRFWVLGEQEPTKLWTTYLSDPENNYQEILKKDVTTASFALFTGIILRTPFPYQGKKGENATLVKKFIKKITKQKNGIKQHKRIIIRKGNKLQSSSKKRA